MIVVDTWWEDAEDGDVKEAEVKGCETRLQFGGTPTESGAQTHRTSEEIIEQTEFGPHTEQCWRSAEGDIAALWQASVE